MLKKLLSALALTAAVALTGSGSATAQAQEKPFIVVASTTSTEQSGLFGFLLPKFTEKTGIAVRVVAQGTGQALDTGRRGDADVLFVHDRKGEDKFVADGFADKRADVMYNDFVVVGPKADPAHIAGMSDIVAGFKKIAEVKAPFASRGDDSGTNRAELRFWADAGVDVKTVTGSWYRETGQGMGPTLNTAAAMNAYSLTDRGTWLNFLNRADLTIVLQGDKKLFNQYGVMLVSKAKHPHVKDDLGGKFVNWLLSPEGQKTIANYKVGGEQLFFPNATPQG